MWNGWSKGFDPATVYTKRTSVSFHLSKGDFMYIYIYLSECWKILKSGKVNIFFN